MVSVNEPSVENRLAAAGMYVRGRLDERLTLESVAAVAGFSPFHFHRVFRVAFGENLNAYITRHRMQKAARELRGTSRSILDIALDCGYESASAFGRAFGRAFEMTPSAYCASSERMSLVPPGSLPPPEHLPEPRIVEYQEDDALSLTFIGPYDAVEPVMRRLYAVAQARRFFPGASVFSLSSGSPDLEDHESLRFEACITPHEQADIEGALADGLRPIVVPGGAYAVFRHRGSYDRITHAYDVLVASWILTGRFELRDAPFVNRYLRDPSRVPAHELECDLALPIR